MIVQAPASVLVRTCEPVDLEIGRQIAADLRNAMIWSAIHDRRGAAGLAAPQIGASARVFVLNGHPSAFINPEVKQVSQKTTIDIEGCLSLPPDVLVSVRRPKWIKISYIAEHGGLVVRKLHGTDARAALHELDHLDGILITDYLKTAA